MPYQVYKADALLLLTALIWGTAFVAQRAGMEDIGPMLYNGLRFALGALVILPLAVRPDPDRGRGRLGNGALLAGGLGAGLVLFLGASFQQVGLQYTTAGKAGFITGLYVVLVPLLGLLGGQRAGAGHWLGVALAVPGLYLLSVTEDLSIGYGDLLELAGALFWALHVLLVGALAGRAHAVRLACVQFAACAGLSLGAALVTEPIEPAGIRAAALPIAYGGLLSVGLGYTLQVLAQRHAVPAHAAILLSLEAVFAALAGWLLLDETLGPRGLAGCALLLAAMLAAQLWPLWGRRRRARRAFRAPG